MKTICGIILACFLLLNFNGYAQERQLLLPENIKDFLHQKIFDKPNALFKAAKSAQQSQNVSLVGRWANGYCQAIFVKDSIAFFGNGGYLEIVNISNPSNPHELSKVLLSSLICGIYVSGNYAYIANGKYGLFIIDVSIPSNPQIIGSFTSRGALSVFVSGNYGYISNGESGLYIIDISNPSSPQEVGFVITPGLASEVYVSGNYAYIADYNAGLRVIDISTPTNPHEVGFYDTNESALKVYVLGNFAYIGDGDDGLRIIDITTPTNPHEVGFYDIPNAGAWGVHVIGNYAYVAFGDRLRVIDVSTPSNPQEIGSCVTGAWAYDVFVKDNYAYIANGRYGIQIVNISTPAAPVKAGFFDTQDFAEDVKIYGNYAIVADGNDGIRVIDIQNLANPHEVGFYDSVSAVSLYINGNYAYVATVGDGLQIFDIQIPTNPQKVGVFNTTGTSLEVYVSGNFAYVADYDAGLRIIDISSPASPHEVGFYDTGGLARGVYVSGNFAYVADDSSGLRIIDVSNPTNPQEVGFYNTPGNTYGVYVSGNYAYVTDGWQGLRVIDVNHPENPQEVGFLDTGNNARGIFISGNYAYIGNSAAGLRIIDINNPLFLHEVGFFNTGYSAGGVYVNGNYIFVADGYDGLYILKNEILRDSLKVQIPDTLLIGQKKFPGDTVLIPVYMNPIEYNHNNGIYSFQTTITYNDSLFQCIGYDSSGTVLSNRGGLTEFTVQFRKDSGRGPALDTLRIAGASDDSLYYPEVPGTPFAFPRPLIKLKFRIPATAHNNDSTILRFNRFMFNEGIPASSTDDGSIKLKLRKKGDVDKNGVIQPIDAILVLRYVIHDTTLDAESREAAEVSGNGEITAYDASLILQYFVGRITVFPAGTYYKQALPSNKSADIVMEWGEVKDGMINLLVKAKNLTEVYGYSLALSYDPGVLTYQGYQSSEWTKGRTAVVRNDGGQLRMAVAGVEPLDGDGEIVAFRFKVNSNGDFNREKLVNLNELVLNEEIIISNATMASLPKTYSLEQNYPNPFNPETRIRYQILEARQVQLIVYNLLGQPVRTLVNEMKPAGVYEVRWDGKNDQGINLASGVYIYRIKAGNFVSTRKLILMK